MNKKRDKRSGRWQRAIIGILLALIMVASVLSMVTRSASGSDGTQKTVRNSYSYIVNSDNVTVTISMDKNTNTTSIISASVLKLIAENVQVQLNDILKELGDLFKDENE